MKQIILFLIFGLLALGTVSAWGTIDSFSDSTINTSLWTDTHTASYGDVFEASNGIITLTTNYRTNAYSQLILNGVYAQKYYDIKNNNTNITFNMASVQNNGNPQTINIGATNIYSLAYVWQNYDYRFFNITYYKNNKTVQLRINGALYSKVNISAQSNNYLTFKVLSSGTSSYLNSFKIKDLKFQSPVVSGGSDNCVYSGSGNWIIVSNCFITGNYNFGSNLLLIKSGYTFIVDSGGLVK